MLNEVNLIGNLGNDPDIKYTQAGDPIANLSVATTEKWKDKSSGEQRENTEWHKVVVFKPLSKVCADYLNKGSKVFLKGKLVTRKWQDNDGKDRYTTEVQVSGFGSKLVMLNGRNDNNSGQQNSPPPQAREPAGAPAPTMDDLDDDIPF
jgi:single-strand DNA-binding protein